MIQLLWLSTPDKLKLYAYFIESYKRAIAIKGL